MEVFFGRREEMGRQSRARAVGMVRAANGWGHVLRVGALELLALPDPCLKLAPWSGFYWPRCGWTVLSVSQDTSILKFSVLAVC